MKYLRNIIIVLILAAAVCVGAVFYYYTNDYPLSYSDITINAPVSAANNADDNFAEFFKRVLKVSAEQENNSAVYGREPQFYIITHTNGSHQRKYEIYVTSVMTRAAYILDTKTSKLYKMNSSAFVTFLSKEEVSALAYSYAKPCAMTLTKEGTSFTQEASQCDWNYITADGTFKKITEGTAADALSSSISGSSDSFEIELPCAATSLKAKIYTDDGTVVFEGPLTGNTLPCNNADGIAHYDITAVWNADPLNDFYGTAKYLFTFDNDVPVSVAAESVSAYQGELIRIFAENASGSDTYSAKCEALGYNGMFFDSPGGKISLLPISCDTAPGIYTIEITENGVERPLEIEVKEQSFETGTLTISTEVTEADQTEQTEALMPLRSYVSDALYITGTFTAPVEGKITTSFGLMRYTNGNDTYNTHNGQDIAASNSPSIAAAQNGKVVYTGKLGITGNTVVIDHGMNVLSYYYHLDSISVKTGNIVNMGDKIGVMGSTGYSTGDHLHFTVMVNGVPTNPVSLYTLDLTSVIKK